MSPSRKFLPVREMPIAKDCCFWFLVLFVCEQTPKKIKILGDEPLRKYGLKMTS